MPHDLMKSIVTFLLTLAMCSVSFAATALTITTSTLPVGTAGHPYPTIQLKAAGGKAPYKWALQKGMYMPNGLKLSSSGVISGNLNKATCTTPTKCYKRIILVVTDSTGAKATAGLGIE